MEENKVVSDAVASRGTTRKNKLSPKNQDLVTDAHTRLLLATDLLRQCSTLLSLVDGDVADEALADAVRSRYWETKKTFDQVEEFYSL